MLLGAGEVRDTLEQLFSINVPAGPEMDAVFARIADAPPLAVGT